MKIISFLMLLIVSTSSFAQASKIVEKKKINWKDYKGLYENYEAGEFSEKFHFLEHVDMYEITYLSDGLKIQAFAAIPNKGETHPVIVYNRGGNRDFGALQLFRGKYKLPVAFLFSQMSSEGYVVVGCNYRGSGASEGEDEFGGSDVNDVLNLIEMLDEIPEADTDNIGMYGWSRGSMMTYLAMSKSDKIKAAVTGAGQSDLTNIDRVEMETGVYAELIPNYWENKEEELKKRSAIYFADKFKKDVPLLMLHGNADWRVKSSNSLELAMKLDELRIPYRLKIYEGGSHNLRSFRADVDKEALDWFAKYLKEGRSIPKMEYQGN
jgi:dipeptidyl aminopeptidase/acylaminoacyl peptidase